MFLSYAKTGNKWEKIAIQYLYIDLIRRDCAYFIKVHNTHHIRSQRKWPYLPTGKPTTLYHAPEEPVINHAKYPDPSLLDSLYVEVDTWDADQYLMPEVSEYCVNVLTSHNMPTKIESAGKNDALHQNAYYLLKEALKQYENSSNLPQLMPPKGGKKWME